ncbi:MAG TPA: PQQ-binding-like beta-propeller repeat protein [Solirubrobacterales bacterium]|jgi:outer membrane protein assembly factor BamB|nr:PQQ-binding-like beta-propeller repeat protein [Solirubrobacterales bacterium]
MRIYPRPTLSFACASLVLAVLALGLGGCGGSDDDGPDGGKSAAASQAPNLDWPFFGRVPQRTHYLPSKERILDPPLKQAWSINTHALIEFPPAISGGVAYVVNKYGNGKAIRLIDRKILWEVNLRPSDKGHQLDVTAPVYHQGLVFGTLLDGYVAAGDARDGSRVWVRKLGTPLESSPLPVGETLYFGTNTKGVLALATSDGSTRWRFDAPAAVKASPSYDNGRIFVADYQSTMFALDAGTGKVAWRTNTSKVAPFGRGGFFSSPAIGFGNVYAARDDGIVYAFDEQSGKVVWSFPTGGQVYGSPAIAEVPGTPATVYIGSENGTFYALDATSGKLRWKHDVGGPIPGTATVIGHTAYTSSFKTGKTIGLDVRTHKKTFEIKQAGYTPVISDGRRLFLIGYFDLIGLEPTGR